MMQDDQEICFFDYSARIPTLCQNPERTSNLRETAGYKNRRKANLSSALGRFLTSTNVSGEYSHHALHFTLIRFRQPSFVASFSEIGFTMSCLFSSLIVTRQGIPILKGKAVSSLTFVGT